MVSFHSSPQWQVRRNWSPEFESFSNKRKREEEDHRFQSSTDQQISERSRRAKNMISLLGNHLPLATPLPLEWQQCLDIKSGQVYFFNTRTEEKTSRDPRLMNPDPPTRVPKSLDLELNLLCGSSEDHQNVGDNFTKSEVPVGVDQSYLDKKNGGGGFLSLAPSPAWLTIDGDEQEMVTAVCKKCHMLVMVCKSSPTCPNCKFVNLPPDQKSPTTLFNQRPSLLC